ncbi:hypothetical protein CAGA_22240 [Caproiciproducens galactitolivorans]|uniref:Uncharacterized protein n=1 Tax=Caproiciproducens galactitolivorans TaxID=642589 RepID=A0A4Z0XW20_9FIRM|nr:hypothetical protein CAGA_22240 [Caproiciproducens galactitolivorans]
MQKTRLPRIKGISAMFLEIASLDNRRPFELKYVINVYRTKNVETVALYENRLRRRLHND